MGLIDHKFEDNFITTSIDRVLNWARESSIWPMGFGLACCAIEMMAASASRFDIEVAFLYPWAMALRDLGWNGFVQVLLFMLLLAAGYVYVWRKGALDWGTDGPRS